jgi:hypothetical protein
VDDAIFLDKNQRLEIDPGAGYSRNVFVTSVVIEILDIKCPIPTGPSLAWILDNGGQKQSIQQEPISGWDSENSCSEDSVSSSSEDEPLVEERPRNSKT